jgi:hypothetical protein
MKFAFLGYSLENKWDAMSESEQNANVRGLLYLRLQPSEGGALDRRWTAVATESYFTVYPRIYS